MWPQAGDKNGQQPLLWPPHEKQKRVPDVTEEKKVRGVTGLVPHLTSLQEQGAPVRTPHLRPLGRGTVRPAPTLQAVAQVQTGKSRPAQWRPAREPTVGTKAGPAQ